MKIIKAHIYGFGKWQDYSIPINGEDSQYITILGSNESGKTTIRQFILFMLFGFPPKKREKFLPKTGGKMGGRMTVSTEKHGEFTIERIHDRNNGEALCYDKAGHRHDEKWLKACLNGMDLQTYSAIFSFDSIDLNHIHTVKEKELGDVLLGIGMAGTDKIYQVEKLLNKQLDEWFKPQGKKPSINKQLNYVDDLHKQLLELERKEKTYSEKKEKESQLLADIETNLFEAKQLKKQQLQIERHLQANPSIQELYQLHLRLKDEDIIAHFPEQGLARYQKLNEQLLPLKSEEAVLRESNQQYQNEIDKVKEQILPHEKLVEVEQFLESKASYQQGRSEYNNKKSEVIELQKAIISRVDQLNLEISINDLSQITFPFYIEEQWNYLKQESDRVLLEKEKIVNEQTALQEKIAGVNEQIQAIHQQLIPDESYRSLKSKMEQQLERQSMVAIEKIQKEQEKQWRNLWRKRNKMSTHFFTASIILSFILLATGFIRSNEYLYWISGVILFIGLGQKLMIKQSAKSIHRLFSNKPLLTNTEMTKEAYDELKQEVHVQDKLREDLDLYEKEGRELQLQQLKADERLRFVEQQQQQVNNRIDEQRTEYPFLQQIEISYWPKLYHLIEQLSSEYKRLKEDEKKLVELENKLKQFESTLRMLATKLQCDVSKEPVTLLKELDNIVEEQGMLTSKIQQYQQLQDQVYQQIHQVEQRMKPIQHEMNKLLDKARATDEEEFFMIGNNAKEQQHLQSHYNQLFYQLKAIFAEDEIKALLSNKPIDQAEYKSELKEIEHQLEQKEQLLEKKRQLLADVRSAITDLEMSEEYSVMKHQLQLEIAKVRQQSKQWAVYQLAKEMLVETKKIYQQQYLPQVLAQTANYFEKLTDGNYVNIYAPVDGLPMRVEDKNGIIFTVSELSQGTSDQLYVALRFALSEMISKEYGLPFLIDDAFVHFDNTRLHKVIELIKNATHHQQVFLFSCQKSFQDITKHQITLES